MTTESVWRFIDDGEGDAAWNMAVDEALFASAMKSDSPPSLRLYQWNCFALSIGRFQSIDRTMQSDGIVETATPLVRRITGGRGILHGDDLTISVSASVSRLGLAPTASVIAVYERLAVAYTLAFEAVGIRVEQGVCERQRIGETRGDCFATRSRADLVLVGTGQKALGSALHRSEDWILQQASLPLHTPEKRRIVESVSSRVFCGPVAVLSDREGPVISLMGLKSALCKGMESAFGVELRASALTVEERRSAERLMQEKYSQAHWTAGGSLTQDRRMTGGEQSDVNAAN